MDKKVLSKKRQRIQALRAKLNKTDYKTLKFFEGELSTDEYKASVAERKAWREEINTLQAEIKAMANSTT